MTTIHVTSCGTHRRAKCNCGWAGKPFTYRRDAHEDAATHYRGCLAGQRVAS